MHYVEMSAVERKILGVCVAEWGLKELSGVFKI
jgi:hypothetical protein